MKVSDIMSDKVVSIHQDENVRTAAKLLRRCDLGALPVCDANHRLRGMLTDRDIVTRCIALGGDPDEVSVSEIMTRGIVTAGPGDELGAVVRTMGTDQVRRLPVLDAGRLVGMVTLCDLARRCGCDVEAAAALSEISANLRRR